MGDIRNWGKWDVPWGKIDLLLGGLPCQDVSMAGRQEGLKEGTRSNLFFVWVDILHHIRQLNPNVKFLLENVKMKKEFLRIFNETLGLHPVLINSALVSAQNRPRYYWTNIRTRKEGLFGELYTDIPQPADKGLLLKDILDKDIPERYYLKDETVRKLLKYNAEMERRKNGFKAVFHDTDKKMETLKIAGSRKDDLIKERIAGVSVTKTGLRPFQNDKYKSGVSEIGTIACNDTKTPTITVSTPPNIINGNLNDFACLTQKRTKEAKKTRKQYEAGELKQPWNERKDLQPRDDGKTNALSTVQKDNLVISGTVRPFEGYRIRRLTPHECCKLQTIPDTYKWDVSETQQYKMLGNGWTVDVIKHILSFLLPESERNKLNKS